MLPLPSIIAGNNSPYLQLHRDDRALRVSDERAAFDAKYIKLIAKPLQTTSPPPLDATARAQSRGGLRTSQSSRRLSAVRRPSFDASASSSQPPSVFALQQKERREAMERETAVKRQVIALRNQLMRTRSAAALQAKHEANRAGAIEYKQSMNAMRGAHLKGIRGAGTPASEAEVRSLATYFIEHMIRTEVDPSKRGWYRLFNQMDEDQDGHISFADLMECVPEPRAML